MRDNVRAFVETAAEAFELDGPIYEFGSYLVEGQEDIGDLRPLFPGRQYLGCDLRDGPGVDRVEDLAQLTLPNQCARTVLCLDTLEHVFEARRAVEELIRVLAPGGILLVAAPMDFRIHDYPSDYWRLTPSCIARLIAPLDATVVGSQGVESFPHTVFGIGCKAPAPNHFLRSGERFMQAFQGRLDAQRRAISWQDRFKRLAASPFRSKGERRRLEQYHVARFAMQAPLGRRAAAIAKPAASAPAMTGTRLDVI